MQAKLPGSLDAEATAGADLRQELNELARLFRALRQGYAPTLVKRRLLDTAKLTSRCYVPCIWLLSPSGQAAALGWIRPQDKGRGLQMVTQGPSGSWKTVPKAGGPTELRDWSSEFGKAWSHSGRYFVTAHGSDPPGSPRGARVQIFDTAGGWLPEYYLGDHPTWSNANVPFKAHACFSADESMAAAAVYGVGQSPSTHKVVVVGVHQRFTCLVPVARLWYVHLAWLPGTTTLVILHTEGTCRLACVPLSASPDSLSTHAESEVVWCAAAPAFTSPCMPGLENHCAMAALQPGRGAGSVAVLRIQVVAEGTFEFHLSLYSVSAQSSSQLSFVTETFDDLDNYMTPRFAEVYLHTSARSVAADLGPLIGTRVYQLASGRQLSSCLFHMAGLHSLDVAHGGRFIAGILGGLPVIVCGSSGAIVLRIDLDQLCCELEPVIVMKVALVKDCLHVTACTGPVDMDSVHAYTAVHFIFLRV